MSKSVPSAKPVRPGKWPQWWRRGATQGAICGWVLALIAAFSGAAALGDNSFLTHLTTGRRMLDGHLPSTDPYSFTAHGNPWVIQSWFASLLYGIGYRVGHGLGIRVLIAVLSGVLAALVWRLTRSGRGVIVRFLIAAPVVLIGTVTWGARPLIFGLVGFAVLLVFLVEERDPRWLVPVMWIWVNTHGSFPLGLALIVVYGFGVWCDRGDLGHVVRTLKWCVAGTLLGAVSPVGPKLLWFPIALLRKQDVLDRMIEWQAPGYTDPWQRLFLVMIVAAVALVPRLTPPRRYRVLLPTVVFVALALTASRNIALASIAATPLLATELAGLGSLDGRVRSRGATVICGALAVASVVLVGVRVSQPSFDLASYPTAAVSWLHATGRLGPDNRLATRDTVGNYIEFASVGRTPVFVDDRVDMFPKRVVDDEATLIHGTPSWKAVLDRWRIDTVLWEKDQPLAALLAESTGWKRVKTFSGTGSNPSWVVYERSKPGR